MAAKNPRWPSRNLVFLTFQHQTAVISCASLRSPFIGHLFNRVFKNVFHKWCKQAHSKATILFTSVKYSMTAFIFYIYHTVSEHWSFDLFYKYIYNTYKYTRTNIDSSVNVVILWLWWSLILYHFSSPCTHSMCFEISPCILIEKLDLQNKPLDSLHILGSRDKFLELKHT